MLIITRYRGQQILIGDDIVITCVKYEEHNGGMRIGIDAPKDVNIVRKEIAEDGKRRDHMSRLGRKLKGILDE